MADSHAEFDQRLNRLSRKHRAMARGYTTQLRPDGLIVTKPRRRRVGVPLHSIILFVAAFLAFKGFMIASLGVATYEERVGRLQSGTVPEQAGAWVMQADPVSNWVYEKLRPIVR